jgi:hypothetical protein
LDLKWRSWVSCDKNTNHWIWSEDHGWVVTKTWDSMVSWKIRYNTIWWWLGVDQPIIKHSNINSKAPHCCNLVWTSRGFKSSKKLLKKLGQNPAQYYSRSIAKSPKVQKGMKRITHNENLGTRRFCVFGESKNYWIGSGQPMNWQLVY